MHRDRILQLGCLIFCFSFSACLRNQEETREEVRFVHLEDFPSQYVNPRNIEICLPPGYSEKGQYAVLYMQDGQMLFDSTTTWNQQEWGVDEQINSLMEAQKIRETIVVGIANTGEKRMAEYLPQKPFLRLPEAYRQELLDNKELFAHPVQSDDYLRFIVKELKPYVDSHFSTLPGQENTFIAGSSMGALLSIYALCEYPEVFGGAACLSTHWPGTLSSKDNLLPAAIVGYLAEALPQAGNHKVYFDYGTETLDADYEPYQLQVDSIIVLKDYDSTNWKTLKFPGADHSERAWKKRLDIPFTFLLTEEDN